MKLVGERRAIAAVIFAFYFILLMLNALSGQLGPLTNAFYGLAGVYGLAFFSLVAGYFWARWYSVGVGLFGLITAAVMFYQMGELHPVIMFFGGTHLAAAVALWGDKMSEPYEGQKEWRERYHMDENAVQRLGRSVMRAGVSLPFVLMYGLMPKPEGHTLGLLVLALAGVGFAGLVRMKTWGILSLAAAGALVVTLGVLPSGAGTSLVTGGMLGGLVALSPFAIGLLLLSAAAPFARPMGRWIAAR